MPLSQRFSCSTRNEEPSVAGRASRLVALAPVSDVRAQTRQQPPATRRHTLQLDRPAISRRTESAWY